MPNEFRTSVGGQALMEGIMMRGPEKICCAVRKPDGTIDLTYDKVVTRWYNKVPLLRGVCNMAENLYKGYKYLMHAADVAMEGVEDAEPESKLDKWLDEHTGPVFQNVLMTCAAFAGVALALFLFTVVRPVSVLLGLAGTRTTWRIRTMVGWFGVRGIGSLYYLMFAIQHGLPEPLALELIELTLIAVTLSIFVHGISVKPVLDRFWKTRPPPVRP